MFGIDDDDYDDEEESKMQKPDLLDADQNDKLPQ